LRSVYASTIIASPLLAMLAYLLFFLSEPTQAEASGSIALSLICVFLVIFVFSIYPLVKKHSKTSLLFFSTVIFFISAVVGAYTVIIMFGFNEIYLPSVAALMLALPSVLISVLWWWLVSTPNPSIKRDWLKPAPYVKR
jgi:predicted permease